MAPFQRCRHLAAQGRDPFRRGEFLRTTLLLSWQLAASALSRYHYQRLPAVPKAPSGDTAGTPLPVSVIIPARNEERRLPHLLGSLAAQRSAAAEVIVVDDESRDRTAAIAAARGARVVIGGDLPEGWTGKNHACHLGAQASRQPRLLFLDADVTLEPAAIACALAYVHAAGLDGLSLFLQQRCETFWERLLLPYAYGTYFTGARAGVPLANGQFILINAAAYARCGGHAAVRASVIDDVALAARCRKANVSLCMARGEHLGSVRMYGGLREIWEGFSKNSFRFVAADPVGGALTVCSAVSSTTLLQLGIRAWRPGGAPRIAAACLSYLISVRGLLFWSRRFRAGLRGALLYPIASLVFMAIALNSMVRVLLRRGVTWKGRSIR